MDIAEILSLVIQITTIAGMVFAGIIYLKKIMRGQKCLLRSAMLAIYYKCQEAREIRQYEYENFVMLYEAYKNLGGNSFIDRVYAEVQEWKIIT